MIAMGEEKHIAWSYMKLITFERWEASIYFPFENNNSDGV